ncbi:MAG: HAD hydrolase-like protein, partial [Planctomycetes bacterium]|nr:HAD hydrolase-like protein [Planctomycetota bacterium]
MRGARPFCRRGVTLLEIVLALGLLISLTSMTYWFYASSLETRRTGTAEAQKLRLVRVVLDRITTEIRQVAAVTRDYGVGLRGAEEQIWLTSLRVPGKEQAKDRSLRLGPPPGEYDLVKVEYKIARHREILHEDGWELPLGLARIGIRIPRPDSAETGEAFEDDGRNSANADEEATAEARRLEELLDQDGASLDGVYYCPYLDGPQAVVEAYRRNSELRKPRPGMLFQAARELNLDLKRSWMIDDSASDVAAGHSAGCS